MATRVGDINPEAVLYLSEKLNKNYRELEQYFNNECGLLGLSGRSSDIRGLIEYEKNGGTDSTLALKIYVNRIKQYIGHMAVVLGGVDLLILAGTVGERSAIIRSRIFDGLDFLGFNFNEMTNEQSVGIETTLSTVDSSAKILVIKTDEMEEIAAVVYQLASN